jgi:drug/metabolite transporter (DMT)-like permease
VDNYREKHGELYMEKQKLGFIFVVLAGALWGTTGTVTKYIYVYGVEPLTLALLRITISFISLYLFALFTKRRVHLKKEDIPLFLGFGIICVAGFNLFYLTAIQLTTVTTAVVLLYTAPAFTLIAVRVILKENFTRRRVIAIIMTFIGIILVVEAYRPGQLSLSVPGVLAGLGAGLTYGVYSIFTKTAIKRGYHSLETVIIALGAGMLFLMFIRPPWQVLPMLQEPVMLWLLVVATAVLGTMMAYIFFVTGLVHVEAGKATLITAVEPVVAILLAMIFLGETITFIQFIGIVAVLSAIRYQR